MLSCDQLANQIFKSQTIPMEWQGKLGALLTIIFWTASPLSRVLETRVVFNADSLSEVLEEDLLYLIAGDEPAWAIVPLGIPDQKMPEKKEIPLQSPFLSTPEAWVCIEDVATARATLPGQRLKRFFPKSSWQQLCQLLGKAIAVINALSLYCSDEPSTNENVELRIFTSTPKEFPPNAISYKESEHSVWVK